MPWRKVRRAGVALSAALGSVPVFLPFPASAGEDEKLALGREVFIERAQPQCGICHTLADAGTDGAVGPDLDELRPTADRVRVAVKGGVGAMPPFEDLLSAEEIEAVSHYVATVTGGG